MKIVALAYNYKGLGEDTTEEPFIFFKNPDSIIGKGDEIRIPKRWHVWPEVELALRIGANHENGELFDAIAVANDVTAANIGNRDMHLAFSKGMDTFLPISDWITEFDLDHILRSCKMYSAVNSVRTQTGWLSEMIHSPSRVYYHLAGLLSLKQGDILLMGTCFHKHYALRDGDLVGCDIYSEEAGITVGALRNKVVEV
jgi:2-keto-4-pentenoate hydratase/2-oxohepta-3-ene-1,7-dioic acid hydratase in catechol pathway